ncbi:hypothetical protein [Aureispira sp. CCB-E]|uniref:hypothetical protein n=1 Tax=Aureispira sp. CCB-E TaxID=3051121 RepID=UPI0028686E38|nr:hypothetical protein [Aureispira sp. CCB-E]WMX14450.1 hypothetical protein QP953_26695 [Aureispira sp. CCB-E]
MTKEDFDFKALKALKYNDYKRQYFKDAVLNKSKGGLILTIFDIGTAKKTCAFIPFLKYKEAESAFKVWKNLKDTSLKKSACKVALGKVSTKKNSDGLLEVTFDISKGLKNPAKIEAAARPLFDLVEKGLKVVGTIEEGDNVPTDGTTVEDTPTSTPDDKTAPAQIKELILGVTGILKEALPKVIIPNIKAKKVSSKDADTINDLFSKLEDLKAVYEKAGSEIQQKIDKHYNSILNQIPKLTKIKTAIDSLLGLIEAQEDVKTEQGDTEEVKRLKELLDYAMKETESIWKNFNKTKDEISNATSQIIKGGDELLNALFN